MVLRCNNQKWHCSIFIVAIEMYVRTIFVKWCSIWIVYWCAHKYEMCTHSTFGLDPFECAPLGRRESKIEIIISVECFAFELSKYWFIYFLFKIKHSMWSTNEQLQLFSMKKRLAKNNLKACDINFTPKNQIIHHHFATGQMFCKIKTRVLTKR